MDKPMLKFLIQERISIAWITTSCRKCVLLWVLLPTICLGRSMLRPYTAICLGRSMLRPYTAICIEQSMLRPYTSPYLYLVLSSMILISAGVRSKRA